MPCACRSPSRESPRCCGPRRRRRTGTTRARCCTTGSSTRSARNGEFSAFDAQDGQEVYREKLLLAATEKEKNAAYASVTLAGQLLYFAGMDGSIVVVKPGRVYEQVARSTVENRLRSTPVFEGTRVYVRAPEHLYCFGE